MRSIRDRNDDNLHIKRLREDRMRSGIAPNILTENARLTNEQARADISKTRNDTALTQASTKLTNEQEKSAWLKRNDERAAANQAWRAAPSGMIGGGGSDPGVGELARKSISGGGLNVDPNFIPPAMPQLAGNTYSGRIGERQFFGGMPQERLGMEQPDYRVGNTGFQTVQNLMSTNKPAMDSVFQDSLKDRNPNSGSAITYFRDRASGKMRILGIEPTPKYEAERGLNLDDARKVRSALDQQGANFQSAQDKVKKEQQNELNKIRMGIYQRELINIGKQVMDIQEKLNDPNTLPEEKNQLQKQLGGFLTQRAQIERDMLGLGGVSEGEAKISGGKSKTEPGPRKITAEDLKRVAAGEQAPPVGGSTQENPDKPGNVGKEQVKVDKPKSKPVGKTARDNFSAANGGTKPVGTVEMRKNGDIVEWIAPPVSMGMPEGGALPRVVSKPTVDGGSTDGFPMNENYSKTQADARQKRFKEKMDEYNALLERLRAMDIDGAILDRRYRLGDSRTRGSGMTKQAMRHRRASRAW